jgi:hypothetical protein
MVLLARRLSCVVGLALVLVLSLAGAGARADATPTWHSALDLTGGASLNGVSCASTTMCMAVDDDVEVSDGGPIGEFDPDTNSSQLNAVSCAPGTRFCMVVDQNGGAVSYTDGKFGDPQKIDGDTAFESVSCVAGGFCMAIDHNDTVFKYSGGSWGSTGTPLTQPAGYSNVTNVACVSSTFCVALASGTGGLHYSTWGGTSWTDHATPFDLNGLSAESLTCTATNFCLATDARGNAARFNGTTTWTVAPVDTGSQPELFSSCSGTTCQAIDDGDNVFSTTDGSSWSAGTPADIHPSTLFSTPAGVSCATTTLCVAVGGLGLATTYGLALTPPSTNPSIAGTATVGQTLTATHATLQNPDAWFSETWVRCDFPDSACIVVPGTTATTYTLTAADAGEYIDARETAGVGLDEANLPTSNVIGPISDGSAPPGGGTNPGGGPGGSPPGTGKATGTGTSTGTGTHTTPKPSTPRLSGSAATSSAGIVTVLLVCPKGATCHGTAVLTVSGASAAKAKIKTKKIGSASYSIAGGRSAKVKIKLTSAGKKLLKKHHNKLAATLTITPKGGRPATHKVTLKVKLKVKR